MTEDKQATAAHRDRYCWMEAVLAATDLTAGAKVIATRLALHKNVKSGRCDPGLETLSEGTAMTRRGAQKAIEALGAAGWIERTIGGHGRKNTNSYQLTWANHGSPCTVENSEASAEQCSSNAQAALRANHGSDEGERKGERKGEQIDTLERTTVRPNTENTINPVNTEINSDGDAEADARASTSKINLELQMKAKQLALRLAAIAGFRPGQVWPPHWQHADNVIMRWWEKGFTNDQIVTGAQVTMQNKSRKDPTPPVSIEYFTEEIEQLAKLQGRAIPPAEQQRYLREIVAKIGRNALGENGWTIVIAATEAEVDDLVLRWSKGEVRDDDLHRFKAEMEARGSGHSGRQAVKG